jgi:hypothetical protein
VFLYEESVPYGCMRVLIAIAPAMYSETLTHVLKVRRPSIEIKAVDPSGLDRQMDLFKPDLLISEETSSGAGYRAISRVEILYNHTMDAQVQVDEKHSRMIDDIQLEELLAIVDETQEFISRDSTTTS